MLTLSHCAQLAHAQDQDRFLAALSVPAAPREALLAVAALNIELSHVHHVVREEMIGHIRYAWWQETLEAAYGGNVRQGQPVLEALAPVIAGGLSQEELLMLVTVYREAFPQMPEVTELLDALSLTLLERVAPAAIRGWRKAHGIIARHRKRYGSKRNGWLSVKLLLA